MVYNRGWSIEIGGGGAAMWSRLPVPQNPAIRSD